ncbi:MAG: nonstructural protein [Microvirus sp.]|nr:MAG: nonstructural protein [Microvirus sp.]
MKMQIVAIRDRAVDTYGRPSFVPSLGHAIRSFGDELNRAGQDSPMNQHPEDYDLFHLGEYDDQDGTFTTIKPKQIAIGKDLYKGE